MVEIYGIKNCDTMKKAFVWLDENGVAYNFHDYKKEGADRAVIAKALEQLGMDSVINRRGTAWRGLPDDLKAAAEQDNGKALALALENPSVIKRPLLVTDNGDMHTGFKPDTYSTILKK